MDRCEECGGIMERPGLFGCPITRHPYPTLPQRIVAAIETDIRNRRGLGSRFSGIDVDILDELRDEWARLVTAEMSK